VVTFWLVEVVWVMWVGGLSSSPAKSLPRTQMERWVALTQKFHQWGTHHFFLFNILTGVYVLARNPYPPPSPLQDIFPMSNTPCKIFTFILDPYLPFQFQFSLFFLLSSFFFQIYPFYMHFSSLIICCYPTISVVNPDAKLLARFELRSGTGESLL
jgi:hypothetical protein